jgi:hypothetical protein
MSPEPRVSRVNHHQKGQNVHRKPVNQKIRVRRTRPARVQKEQLELVVSTFQELVTLLEEYAPVWYTEQHHQRAVAARRLLHRLSVLRA